MSIPFGQLWVALANLVEIVRWIGGIGQRSNHVNHDEPPLVVVDDAANFLLLKQRDALVGIGVRFAHVVCGLEIPRFLPVLHRGFAGLVVGAGAALGDAGGGDL